MQSYSVSEKNSCLTPSYFHRCVGVQLCFIVCFPTAREGSVLSSCPVKPSSQSKCVEYVASQRQCMRSELHRLDITVTSFFITPGHLLRFTHLREGKLFVFSCTLKRVCISEWFSEASLNRFNV